MKISFVLLLERAVFDTHRFGMNFIGKVIVQLPC